MTVAPLFLAITCMTITTFLYSTLYVPNITPLHFLTLLAFFSFSFSLFLLIVWRVCNRSRAVAAMAAAGAWSVLCTVKRKQQKATAKAR